MRTSPRGQTAPLRRPGAFDVVVAVGGLLLALLAVQNLGPALDAARHTGVWGTFTARAVSCVQHPGHESCSWTGAFRSDDGRLTRQDVALYGSERTSFAPGERARAFDTGRRGHVYGPGGSNEWVVVVLLLLAGLGLASWRLLGPRRRQVPNPAQDTAPVTEPERSDRPVTGSKQDTAPVTGSEQGAPLGAKPLGPGGAAELE